MAEYSSVAGQPQAALTAQPPTEGVAKLHHAKGERTMRITIARRNLLATGASALFGAVTMPGLARASASGRPGSKNDEIIRKWYAAWEKKDLATFNMLLADNFTFSSAAGDDHISKSTFKTQCWDTQVDFIGHFDLERITTGADDAFVKYLCHTKNGKTFRNVEYLRIKNGQLESIECYFGAQSSFPSAVSTGQE
jgi:ketosteroid isomerase-like protein